MLARREWIALPYELACESGSRLDPMSLRAECDHLVIELALRRLCRRTVITPRLASIPNSFIKSCWVLVALVKPSVAIWANARHIVFLGKLKHWFTQALPSHSIWLGIVVILSGKRMGWPEVFKMKITHTNLCLWVCLPAN